MLVRICLNKGVVFENMILKKKMRNNENNGNMTVISSKGFFKLFKNRINIAGFPL